MTCVTEIDVKKLINFPENEARKKSGTVINPGVNNSGQTIGSMMGGGHLVQTDAIIGADEHDSPNKSALTDRR